MNLTSDQERAVEIRVETARAQGHAQGMVDMASIDSGGSPAVETVAKVARMLHSLLATLAPVLPGEAGAVLQTLGALLGKLGA